MTIEPDVKIEYIIDALKTCFKVKILKKASKNKKNQKHYHKFRKSRNTM
jgi:hypothetical protein